MKKTNAGKEEQLKTCWSTTLKYIGNIAKVSLPALRPATSLRSTAPYSSCLQPMPALSCPVCFWVKALAQSLQVRRLLCNLYENWLHLAKAWDTKSTVLHPSVHSNMPDDINWLAALQTLGCLCNLRCLTDTYMPCCVGPKGRQVQEDPSK